MPTIAVLPVPGLVTSALQHTEAFLIHLYEQCILCLSDFFDCSVVTVYSDGKWDKRLINETECETIIETKHKN